ncbi:MAG TPA: DUF4339 domain-containing protein, partial [Desulfuromonadaceae bacterium]|nr:DUF4339 domain-containing protein [Desulfuromonadaceae bacterium]
MYTIIGGDGKQYGPISGEEIRKWIQEHRLNGQSQARAEGETDFRPLSTFSEFADLLTTSSPIETGHVSGSDDWLTRDYELDIAGCVSRGWKLFNDNAGTLWGGAIVAFIIIAVACFFLGFIYNLVTAFIIPKALLTSWVARTIINIPLQFLMALVIGPMLGGIYYIFLQRLRGQPAGLGDIFAGFQ